LAPGGAFEYTSAVPIPGILHACDEARFLAKYRWKLMFQSVVPGVCPKVFFDQESDVLHCYMDCDRHICNGTEAKRMKMKIGQKQEAYHSRCGVYHGVPQWTSILASDREMVRKGLLATPGKDTGYADNLPMFITRFPNMEDMFRTLYEDTASLNSEVLAQVSQNTMRYRVARHTLPVGDPHLFYLGSQVCLGHGQSTSTQLRQNKSWK